MRTVQIDNEPYLYRLLPDSEVERMALAQVVRAEVERNRDHIQLPHHPDHSATWESAGRADDAGYVAAAVVIGRARTEAEADPIAALFDSTPSGSVEVARVGASLFVVVDDPDQPTRLEVMYEIPQCDWAPSPHGSSNYLHYPPILYTAR